MSKIGLVFAGGGGKGAYEIGVWKALKEYGIDKNISAISGTSVGGLNGALFTKGDFEQALKVWEEMSPKKILQVDIESIATFIGKIIPQTRVATFVGEKLGFLKSQGVFGQEGLESIIRDSLQEGELKDKLPFYICATDVSTKTNLKPVYKKLNDLDFEDIVQYLLATSAIPVAFPKNKIDGIELLDGFLTDNTPMKPLIEDEECDKIIVVLLGRSETIIQQKAKYPNVNFWEIVPTRDTKEEIGSLDFKSETARSLLTMGYLDTVKILQNLYEFMLIEQEYIKKGETLRIQEDGFKKQVLNNSLLRSEYKKLQSDYDDISSLQFLLTSNKAQKNIVNTEHKNEITLNNISQELEVSLEKYDCELIDTQLDDILESMGDNSKEMTKFAFDAVTSLASNDGKINYQSNQGHFSRFFGGITGKNHKLQADINLNFSKAIYANTQMIKKLAERNNLTLDICISLGNKVNFLAQNQNQLQLQNNQQFKMISSLRDAIFTLADLTRTAIKNNTTRIEKLEYGQKLLNWNHHLKSSIKELNNYESAIKVASDFYEVVQNSYDDSATEFLYSALINCGFDEISINPSGFIEYIIDNEPLKESVNFIPVPKAYEAHIPVFSSVSKIYEKVNKTSFDEVVSRLENIHNITLDVDMSGTDFVFELLNGFKVSSDMKLSLSSTKNKMIESLDNISDILKDDDIDAFDNDIAKLKQNIDDFKVIIPIIGKFSSGKSKLLNTYVNPEHKLFEVDTNPTTALPCEVRYGTQNIVKVHDKNNSIFEIDIDEIFTADLTKAKYLQYFLGYPIIKHKNDLVIVDMPGFESSNLNHNNAINQYFNKGDHYILALNCETANDSSILKHIKEILSYGATFSIVITKSDKKLPQDIDEIVRIVKQNILNKYPNQKFFIGATSSFRNDISDFEKIIDDVYENSSLIFRKKYQKDLDFMTSEIIKYYNQMLNAPNDLIEFEKKLTLDKKSFEESVSKLNTSLTEIKFKIVSDGYISLTSKIESVLNANLSYLVTSAKNNSLANSITELLRSHLNSMFQSIANESLQVIENDASTISNDLNISFSGVNINTELSFFEAIKNFFFKTQDQDIRKELINRVIPTVVNDIGVNIKSDLESLYESIKKLTDENIDKKRKKANSLELEIKEKISLQTQDYERLQEKFTKSLEKIKEV